MANFTGTGSFNTSNGTLEYATQEILKTRDDYVVSEFQSAHSFLKGAFGDVCGTIQSWERDSDSYYKESISNSTKIFQELKNLTGTVMNLPSVIEKSADKSLSVVSSIDSKLSSVDNSLSIMNLSLASIKTSNNDIKYSLANTNTYLKNLSTVSGGIVTVEAPRIEPNFPDYSDALSSISGIIGSIRDSISGIDLSGTTVNIDVSDILPDLHTDLSQMHEVIRDLAQLSGEEDRFEMSDLTHYLINIVDRTLIPRIDSIAGTFSDEIQSYVEDQTRDIVRSIPDTPLNNAVTEIHSDGISIPDSLTDTVQHISETLDDFFEQAEIWYRDLDEDFRNNFTSLTGSVQTSGSLSNSSVADLLDGFEDSTTDLSGSLSSGFSWLGNAFSSGFNRLVSFLSGYFTASKITNKLESIHTDTTKIIQNTGLSRVEASELRQSVNQNLINIYGKSTLSAADMTDALDQSMRAGLVDLEQIKQATMLTASVSKILPDVSIDFSSGWAKYLMATEKNADEFIGSAALLMDDFSNNYYVTAATLEKVVSTYYDAAKLFNNDVKSFTKAVGNMMAVATAQEEAGIQSMDVNAFLDRIAWTSVDQLSDADYARLANQFGVSGNELFEMRSALRDPNSPEYRQWVERLFSNYGQSMSQSKQNVTGGGALAEVELSKAPVFGMSYDEFRKAMNDDWSRYVDVFDAASKDIQSYEDFSGELASRTEQAANNTWMENVSNIANSLSETGWLADLLKGLSDTGIDGVIVGGISGFVGSLFTNAIGSLIRGAFSGGSGGNLLGNLFSLFGSSGTGGFLSQIGSLFGRGATGAAGTTGAGGFLSRLGSLFGRGGTTAVGTTAAAGEVGTTVGELASTTTRVGETVAEVGGKAGAKGLSKVVPKLAKIGSKVAGWIAVADAALDAGRGANKSEEWLGNDSYRSRTFAGYGGILGGEEGGLGNAALNALKWGTIGTMIAPGAGTAIGAVAGGITGLIGGDKIAKFIDDIHGTLKPLENQFDIFLEDNLGAFGHAIAATKAMLFDWIEAIQGGIFSALGALSDGLSGALEKVLQGDFLGAIGSIGEGVVGGAKELYTAFETGVEDTIDDWTLSARDRIAKRDKELTDLAQSAVDTPESLDTLINDHTTDLSSSMVEHTSESIFGANTGRKGSLDVSGFNSFLQSDSAAGDFVDTFNTPIDHSRDVFSKNTNSTADWLTDASLDDTIALHDSMGEWKPVDSKVSGQFVNNTMHSVDSIGGHASGTSAVNNITDRHFDKAEINTPVETADLRIQKRSPLTADINKTGPENISTPIVDALNTNMSNVVSLLEKLVFNTAGNKQSTISGSSGTQRSIRMSNNNTHKDAINRTNVLNYQDLN